MQNTSTRSKEATEAARKYLGLGNSVLADIMARASEYVRLGGDLEILKAEAKAKRVAWPLSF